MSANEKHPKITKSDQEWREQLTDEQFRVTRKHGTEAPFSHSYSGEKGDGHYHCICCGEPLFSSEHKYDSGTGWPSYWAPHSRGAVSEHEDNSLLMSRTEVRCANCEAHLGHVFPDGPEPTGLRYCINGEALELKAANASDEAEEEEGRSPEVA